jgi:hypothetical protein
VRKIVIVLFYALRTAIRIMRGIICCCVVFALRAKTTQQQVFSFFSKGFSKFRIAALPKTTK